MTKQICITVFAGAFLAIWLFAQNPQTGTKTAFVAGQQPEINGWERTTTMTMEYSGVQAVSGRPFSATQTTKTVQTLGDGTEISNSSSTQIYRDILGRSRTESTAGGKTVVAIRDPVNGINLRIFPESKTALRTTMAGRGARGGTMPRAITVSPDGAVSGKKKRGGPEANSEDLGIQNINGIPALGTRRTEIIPVGQIGNNREIRVVNERWYSEDLQMLVKSVNSDPRFGVTTYELTDISRENPDPSLFEIPPGYAITDTPGGGDLVIRGVPAPTVKKDQ